GMQQQQVEMREYEWSSLVDVQGWSEIGRGEELFDSIVVFENYPQHKPAKGGSGTLSIDEFSGADLWRVPLKLAVGSGEELILMLNYDCALFDAASVSLMIEQLRVMLQSLSANRERTLSELMLAYEADERKLIERYDDERQAQLEQVECLYELSEV
ncbi:MAG: hypothetical protein QOH41_699, partial [Blastocatellia bacterium]|nr:hypothetical protein [Blastocatellia bacterium]